MPGHWTVLCSGVFVAVVSSCVVSCTINHVANQRELPCDRDTDCLDGWSCQPSGKIDPPKICVQEGMPLPGDQDRGDGGNRMDSRGPDGPRQDVITGVDRTGDADGGSSDGQSTDSITPPFCTANTSECAGLGARRTCN